MVLCLLRNRCFVDMASSRAVRRLSSKDRECIPISSKTKKMAEEPRRRLMYSTFESKKNTSRYCIVVELKNEAIELYSSADEKDVKSVLSISCMIIPCFWSPKVLSHLSEIFTTKVLNKLVELMREHGDTWSVAHMCISLPLPEDTMTILLASDSFKDHFTSVQHPKGYTLLHLAIEHHSLTACRAIIRCSDRWLSTEPGFHIEDKDGVIPIQKAVISKSWACLDYLVQSQSAHTSAYGSSQHPRLFSKSNLKHFQNAVKAKRSTTVKKMLASNPNFANAGYVDGSIGLHRAQDCEVCVRCFIMLCIDKYITKS